MRLAVRYNNQNLKMSYYLPPELVNKVLSYITNPVDGESWWQSWYGDTQEEEYYDVLEILRNKYIKKHGDFVVQRHLIYLGKRRRWQGRRKVVYNNFDDQHIDLVIQETDLLIRKLMNHFTYLKQSMWELWTMPEDTPLITQVEMKDKVVDVYNMVNSFKKAIPKMVRYE